MALKSVGGKYEGVWKTAEAEKAATFGAKPGDPKFADVNKDGAINAEDKTIIGNASAEWNFGFSNNFTYKNLDLSRIVFDIFS